jgi:hypothetical protein
VAFIAGHADSRTTKLYDRRGQKVLGFGIESNFVTAAVWTYAQPLARIAADCLLFRSFFVTADVLEYAKQCRMNHAK